MEIKRCPKCGSDSWRRITVLDTNYGYKVHCIQCHSETKEFQSKTDAIKAWNNRESIERKNQSGYGYYL